MRRWIRGWHMTEGGAAGRTGRGAVVTPSAARGAIPGHPSFAALRVTCLLLALFATPLLGQSLGKRLDRRLDTAPFNRTLWGVLVLDQNGKKLYGRNEGRLFTPASNTKLVVTAVAAAMLPADFRVRTSVYASAPVVNG